MRPERQLSPLLPQAVSPTLFQAGLQPDLLAVVLTADFMSEAFVDMAAKARKAVRHPSLPQAMSRLQQFVNARFYHAVPREFEQIYGLYEQEMVLDAEEQAAGAYAMEIIQRFMLGRSVLPEGHQSSAQFLSNGAFPKYVYPVADIVEAYALRTGGGTGSVLGWTSCADECILLAALAVKLGLCALKDVVLLGSPLHYTLFLLCGEDTYWFNAKREMLDGGTWAEKRGSSASERQRTFLEKIYVYDRMITPFGSCIFTQRKSTLAAESVTAVIGRICDFLGFEPAELVAFAADPPPALQRPESTEVNREIEGTCLPQRVRELSKEAASGSLAAAARYAYRSLDVPEPMHYAAAAKSSFKAFVEGAQVFCADDALELVRAIPDRRSVLQGGNRIAMPDEVFYFQTASEVERALLFYTLLSHSHEREQVEREPPKVVLREAGPSVTWQGKTWGGDDF